MTICNELEEIQKKVVVAYFKVPHRYLLGGTEENHLSTHTSVPAKINSLIAVTKIAA